MPARPRSILLWITGLVAAVCVAYAPAFGAGFIWDDDAHVTLPHLRSWSGLTRIWTEPGATQQYYPMLHSAFWVQYKLWGVSALGYHSVNVLLHLTAAVLLALVLRRLSLPYATTAAFVWALHPVQVESVAWISEQKNTLSTVLYLAAALTYLRFDRERRASNYIAASLLFIVAVLSKTVVATLPAALLVVFWWQRGRLCWRRDVLPLVPWFAIGTAAGLLTAWFERTIIGAQGAAFELGLLERLLLAGRVAWFYISKLLWPANLTFIYPRWTIDPRAFADWLPLVAVLGVLIVLWTLRRRSRAPLAAALLFGGSLFPVLGFFDIYPFQYSFVADHFQYLGSIPMLVFGVVSVMSVVSPSRISAEASTMSVNQRFGPAVLILALGLMTWRQSHDFRDSRTLFRATIARNPACWMAYNNLGKELMTGRANLPEAIVHLRRAVALRPGYAEAHNNLGLALTQSGSAHEGIPHLRTALELKPHSYQTHNNLGIALAGSGRAEEALAAFQRAADLKPDLPNIHENWAKALLLLGRKAESDERFAIAARLRQGGSPQNALETAGTGNR